MHVTHEDARAYAAWVGKDLPTEVEWRDSRRAAVPEGATYPWGNAANPEGRFMANTWQGLFPFENLVEDGYEGTSPVDASGKWVWASRHMVGNVWEWTVSPFAANSGAEKSCCHRDDLDPRSTLIAVKGGSHLCAPNYCLRYRPAARQGETTDTSTCHIGFRCVVRD